VVDGRLEKSILRLTQPSLAGTGAELGKREQKEDFDNFLKDFCSVFSLFFYI
jgi:hypothetical protein